MVSWLGLEVQPLHPTPLDRHRRSAAGAGHTALDGSRDKQGTFQALIRCHTHTFIANSDAGWTVIDVRGENELWSPRSGRQRTADEGAGSRLPGADGLWLSFSGQEEAEVDTPTFWGIRC